MGAIIRLARFYYCMQTAIMLVVYLVAWISRYALALILQEPVVKNVSGKIPVKNTERIYYQTSKLLSVTQTLVASKSMD